FIQGMFILSNLLDISWFFTGTENFKPIVVRNSLVKISTFILVLIFIRNINDLWLYAVIMVGSEFFGQCLMWIDFRKYGMFKNLKELNGSFNLVNHFKGTLLLFLPQVIVVLYTTLNTTMIGAIRGVEEVGFYDMASKIINTLITIMTALSVVM